MKIIRTEQIFIRDNGTVSKMCHISKNFSNRFLNKSKPTLPMSLPVTFVVINFSGNTRISSGSGFMDERYSIASSSGIRLDWIPLIFNIIDFDVWLLF